MNRRRHCDVDVWKLAGLAALVAIGILVASTMVGCASAPTVEPSAPTQKVSISLGRVVTTSPRYVDDYTCAPGLSLVVIPMSRAGGPVELHCIVP